MAAQPAIKNCNREVADVEGITPGESLALRGLNTQWLPCCRFEAGAEGPSLHGGNSCRSLAAVQDQNSKKQLSEGIFFLIYTTRETESTVRL